jgi:hypothetical protein
MDPLWIGWMVGIIQGLVVGLPVGILLARGKAFFYRFVLKKTPVEPVIIDTGKISVPTKKIEENKFEFDGDTYIAPPERMIPKSLMVGSVSAIYLKGIPMPLHITHNTLGFKLTDNTILCDVMRSIFNSDSLRKLFTKEKITHVHLALLIILGIFASVMTLQLIIAMKSMFPQFIDEFNSSLETMRGAFAEYFTENPANTANPKGPTAVPPPPGG